MSNVSHQHTLTQPFTPLFFLPSRSLSPPFLSAMYRTNTKTPPVKASTKSPAPANATRTTTGSVSSTVAPASASSAAASSNSSEFHAILQRLDKIQEQQAQQSKLIQMLAETIAQMSQQSTQLNEKVAVVAKESHQIATTIQQIRQQAPQQASPQGSPPPAKAPPSVPAAAVTPKSGVPLIDDIWKLYKKVGVLGEGASCQVMHVLDEKNVDLACKILKKAAKGNQGMFENEAAILRRLNHPNILEYRGCHQDANNYYLLTHLCLGGELFDRVIQSKHFSEKVASSLALSILKSVHHCHTRNVVHRDLKPENFVFETKSADSDLKLIDFGLAKYDESEKAVIIDVTGSAYYVAPEVLDDTITRNLKTWKASDMWSIGVIIYILLFGEPPFNGENDDETFVKIRAGKFEFPHTRISAEARDLIQKLLVMNINQRLSAEQALKHPWIADVQKIADKHLGDGVAKSLADFRNRCALKRVVEGVLNAKMSEEDKSVVKALFNKYDENKDGQLGVAELANVLKDLGGNPGDAKDIVAELDKDGNGTVSLEEFTSIYGMAKLQDEHEIKKSFDLFDRDGDGFITTTEIKKQCNFLSEQAIKALVAEVDKNSDGQLSYEEWVSAMTSKKGIQLNKGK